MTRVVVRAPGRVNLIGDHTDYAGGLALPMAIDLATTIAGERGGDALLLQSVDGDVAAYVEAVAREIGFDGGFIGDVTTTIPIGSGLSSSAALEVALVLALGAPPDDRVALARACQRAEHAATGVPCGVMDQLASLCGVAGHALLIDCASLEILPVPIPADVEIVVVDSGVRRQLVASGYAQRRAEVEVAERDLGSLRDASLADLARIAAPVARRRARHVVTENARVHDFVAALASGDLARAGAAMAASHASLRDDFEASTPTVDALVERLSAAPGVHGARLTGGGWGGCVVALCDEGALPDEGWHVQPSAGATVEPA